MFAPVGVQPLKPAGHAASFDDRAAMTGLAIADEPAFELSLMDSPEYAPNYTVDALTRLRESLPVEASLFLLLGADAFGTLPRWHRADELPFLATLVVASRPGQSLDAGADLPECLPPSVRLMPREEREERAIRYCLRNTSGAEADLYILPDLNYEISATDLRREIHENRSGRPGLLDPRVLAYIRERGLYR
jgi:nicotinate-nucleotide adenylyltransferase